MKGDWSAVTPRQWRTLVAAALGWALDAFDVMLYALVLTHVMRDLSMDKPTAGLLGTLTLLASGLGGVLFGYLADRVGRTRALMLSILTYSICSFLSGLATSVAMLAVFRFVLGLGMGGEWNTGATLVAETWPAHLRARALALVQSSWALGYAAAALTAGFLLRYGNWRHVFFVGIAPALIILWIRSRVPESEMWLARQKTEAGAEAQSSSSSAASPSSTSSSLSSTSMAIIFSPAYRKTTIVLLLLNFCGMFAWWGLFTWLPPYLSLPVAEGGRGFSVLDTTKFLVVLNLVGMFPGYAGFGWMADRIGRRKSFILYTAMAALLVPFYAQARAPWAILWLGVVVAFFGTGFFSGSGIMGSEVFPTAVRARALGFTYNGARALSSVAPFVIGYVGKRQGLSGAFYLCAAGFFLASLLATQLPETKGKVLE